MRICLVQINLLSVSLWISERSEPDSCSLFYFLSKTLRLFRPDPADLCTLAQVLPVHLQHLRLTSHSHIRSIRDDILLLCSSRAAPVSLWASRISEGVHNKRSTIKLQQRLHSCQTNMEAGQLAPHDLVKPIDPFFFNESNLRSGTGADERHVEASRQHVCCQRSESCWRLHTWWCHRLCAASFNSSI